MRGLHALLLFVAACANAEVSPDAGPIDATPVDAPPPDAPPPDAPTSAGFFLDDLAADFTGGTFDDAVVEPWGAIAPRAYYTGGLRVRGSDTGVFADAAAATWAMVEGMSFTGTEAPARALVKSWGTGTPAGVALTAPDDLTLAYDGEIYLEPGAWTFHVLGDDHAFLELAPPGGAFTRIASANWPAEASGGFTVVDAGWHPIRIAHCERAGASQLRIEHTGPGVPVRAPISRQRLRFAASGTTGLALAAFDDGRLLGDYQTTIDRTAPAARLWNTGAPADLGITSPDDFATRWSGQLRIDAGGDFVFRYTTDDGQRMWIDGVSVLDQFDDATHDASTSPIALEPGWHDLVIDHSESTGGAQAMLGITAGPELVGATLPADRLRPVEARGERFDTAVDHTDRVIPALGQLEATIVIDAPPGAKTRGVDVGWVFDHAYHGDLELSLVAPDGSVTVVRDHVGGAASGTVTERLHLTSLDETNAAGTWRLRIRDTVSLDGGTLRDLQLTVHHRGGAAPIAEAAVYTSPIKDLGDAITEYVSFAWADRLGPGSSVRMYVRNGESMDALLAAPWSSPLVGGGGGPPPLVPHRYFQYRIELDSDGDGSAAVDWVRLDTIREIP